MSAVVLQQQATQAVFTLHIQGWVTGSIGSSLFCIKGTKAAEGGELHDPESHVLTDKLLVI